MNCSKPPEMLEKCVSISNSPPLEEGKEDRSMHKYEGESGNYILQCAECKARMHGNQKVYMYNDQAFCCRQCRAKVMAFDRCQHNPA